MPQDTTSEQDPDDPDAEFVEIDPTARYGRVSLFFLYFYEIYHFHEEDHMHLLVYCWVYFIGTVPNGFFFFFGQYKEVLGRGAFKKVYPFSMTVFIYLFFKILSLLC